MVKKDYKKELKEFYLPSSKSPSIVNIPAWNFIMVDGAGDPNTSKTFQNAVEALFSVAYTLKFHCKKYCDADYSVMPLEGLWWADDMADFLSKNKDTWKWRLMIMQPEVVTKELYTQAVDTVKLKKNLDSLPLLRFENFEEGLSAQISYQGSFDLETSTIHMLHDFITKTGHKRTGMHHEIYLNDFRKVSPEKMKIVIRQPMS